MSLAYRPEVDGLRCIAVLLVILHHLNTPGFSGGFVGVDVFFVISGYLITGITLKEFKSSTFSFGSFYKRRVIRLAPAYFTVIAVTAFLAFMLMLPAELENFSVSAVYSTFFAANFYMWDAVGGYFGSGADTTPLLHLWSLAVEEQFYIFWPVTLLLLFRTLTSRGLICAVFFLFSVSLMISEWGAIHYRAAAYYLMPTRAFELLLGAVIAFLPPAYLARVPSVLRLVLSGFGISLILYASLAFSEETRFPGLNALVPCMGAFLLIAFGRARDPWLGSLLSNPVAVGIGKISYPAYLWHWPIIAFLNLQLVELTPAVAFAVLLGTMVMAWLTYHFIEIPMRDFRNLRWQRVVFAGFVMPAGLLSATAVSAVQMQGIPGRFDDALAQRSEAVLSYANDIRGRCNEGPVTSPLGADHCILGLKKPTVDFLLVGDSHANHFTGMLDVLGRDAQLRGYDVTQSNSPFLVDIDRHYLQDSSVVLHGNFRARNEFIKNQLVPSGYKFVVLAANFPSHLDEGLFSDDGNAPETPRPELFRKAMVKTIELIIQQGSIPVLIKGNPTFDFDVSQCTLNNLRFDLDQNCNMERDSYQKHFVNWSAFVEELQHKFSNLIVIDPAKVMCDETSCYSELEDTPLYKDAGHLNYEGSMLVGELYLRQIGNPFLAENQSLR